MVDSFIESTFNRGAQVNVALANPRILLGCFYRCFCSHGVQDTSIEPKRMPIPYQDGMAQTIQRRSRETYELQIDAPDDWYQGQFNFQISPDNPTHSKRGSLGAQLVETVRPTTETEITLHHRQLNHGPFVDRYMWPISMHEGNKIQCRGKLPQWPYPGGYRSSDFNDLQSLCAVQWSGGGL